MDSIKYCFDGIGPKNNCWLSEYLFCPYCKELIVKNTITKSCSCGNIEIDGDSLRIYIHVKEEEIPTFTRDENNQGLSIDEIKEQKYKTVIKPISTKIKKISRIDNKRLIVLEDYYLFSGISNLYILEKYKHVRYCEMQNASDFYVSFDYHGQNYIEANSYNCIRSTIDLKSLKIIDSMFVK